MTEAQEIRQLLAAISDCRECVERPDGDRLPHEPRPVLVMSSMAKIRIIGQAPGTRVHASGKPFTDPSGDRLREWMGVDETQFYNSEKISITPMGFCFPGLNEKGGDLPPRKECARKWQDRVTQAMPQTRLVLLIGQYAQKQYLQGRFGGSLTETVSNWREVRTAVSGEIQMPLPHPSWRNNAWIKKNLWFTSELLPQLRQDVQNYL